MTSIVGIRCTDGVVIGADSAASFSDGRFSTIEQLTDQKIKIIGGSVIIAGTGYVGHMQRFSAVVDDLWSKNAFAGKTDMAIAQKLSSDGLKEFDLTHTAQNVAFTALVAYPAKDQPTLCELPGGVEIRFQPEIKRLDDFWFASWGSGRGITDPFLALFRNIFWSGGAPTLQGGIFTTLWALKHACEVNPGGIKEPIHIAVLDRDPTNKGRWRARKLDEAELKEQEDMVDAATTHFSTFRDILQGEGRQEPPKAPGI